MSWRGSRAGWSVGSSDAGSLAAPRTSGAPDLWSEQAPILAAVAARAHRCVRSPHTA